MDLKYFEIVIMNESLVIFLYSNDKTKNDFWEPSTSCLGTIAIGTFSATAFGFLIGKDSLPIKALNAIKVSTTM